MYKYAICNQFPPILKLFTFYNKNNKSLSVSFALNTLDLETLNNRREYLCLTFAQRSSKHPTIRKMFPLNEKAHKMNTRNPMKFKVQFAHNERLKKSPIIYMQNLLNEFGL